MARPRKNNAEYFSHDADLRNSRNLRPVRSKYKNDGYATFVMLLEMLTDADNFRLLDNTKERGLIAGDIGIDVELFEDILEMLVDLELIQSDGEWLWSDSLLERMQPVLKKRTLMQEKYQIRGITPGDPPPPPKPKAPKKQYMTLEKWQEFLDKYPKKQNLYKAKEKFLKLELNLWDDIIKGLALYETSDKWMRGYKHDATTWINGHLWEDTPDQYVKPTRNTTTTPNERITKKTGYSDSKV